ncbi:MAG: FHA domain-containing protein, partial [Deinococcus sp.]|nr:FHA domain-containing protein [Deinococcus sp.]
SQAALAVVLGLVVDPSTSFASDLEPVRTELSNLARALKVGDQVVFYIASNRALRPRAAFVNVIARPEDVNTLVERISGVDVIPGETDVLRAMSDALAEFNQVAALREDERLFLVLADGKVTRSARPVLAEQALGAVPAGAQLWVLYYRGEQDGDSPLFQVLRNVSDARYEIMSPAEAPYALRELAARWANRQELPEPGSQLFGLVVDTSPSFTALQEATASAAELLGRLGPTDRVVGASFGGDGRVLPLADGETNPLAVAAALGELRLVDGQQADLLKAVNRVALDFVDLARLSTDADPELLILTDGLLPPGPQVRVLSVLSALPMARVTLVYYRGNASRDGGDLGALLAAQENVRLRIVSAAQTPAVWQQLREQFPLVPAGQEQRSAAQVSGEAPSLVQRARALIEPLWQRYWQYVLIAAGAVLILVVLGFIARRVRRAAVAAAPVAGPALQVGFSGLEEVIQLQPGESIKVGSSADADLLVEDRAGSEVRAELSLGRNGELAIRDLGSLFPLQIDSQVLRPGERRQVSSGSRVRFAEGLEFYLEAIPVEERSDTDGVPRGADGAI